MVRRVIIHCLLPILVGGLIYVTFRSKALRMFQWFDVFCIDEFMMSIRNYGKNFKGLISDWFIYSLPDGLWIYSFTSALIIAHAHEWNKYKYWLIVPFILGAGVELLQYLGLFKGTFDVNDLWCYSLGMLFSIWILGNEINIKNCSKMLQYVLMRKCKRLLK